VSSSNRRYISRRAASTNTLNSKNWKNLDQAFTKALFGEGRNRSRVEFRVVTKREKSVVFKFTEGVSLVEACTHQRKGVRWDSVLHREKRRRRSIVGWRVLWSCSWRIHPRSTVKILPSVLLEPWKCAARGDKRRTIRNSRLWSIVWVWYCHCPSRGFWTLF
jgi:hypothetical protein